MKNIDSKVCKLFGDEWHSFTNNERPFKDLKQEFDRYFSIFPWEKLPDNAEGFDAGCGTGRWTELVLEGREAKIAKINCVEPSKAIEIAKNKLSKFNCVSFYNKQ